MQAFEVREFGDSSQLHLENVPRPEPGPDEVLIKVEAAGLNPIDNVALSGGMGERIKLPAILGVDVSGVIEQVGSEVRDHEVGEQVFGMINLPGSDGTFNGRGFAEFAPALHDQVVVKPAALSFEQAAGLSAVGLTAKQALEQIGEIQEGQRVLIHGAAGGVGHMAVQIARLHHAYIFATASGKDAEFVRSLGANEVIDYTTQRFEDVAKQVDLVLDTVGGDVLRRSLDVLAPGGTVVTTRWPELPKVEGLAREKGVQAKAVSVHADREQLAELAEQAVSGNITVRVDQVYPFDQLPAALDRLKAGGVQGKLVVRVRPA